MGKVILPNIMRMNADASVSYAKSGGLLQGESAADTGSLFLCARTVLLRLTRSRQQLIAPGGQLGEHRQAVRVSGMLGIEAS